MEISTILLTFVICENIVQYSINFFFLYKTFCLEKRENILTKNTKMNIKHTLYKKQMNTPSAMFASEFAHIMDQTTFDYLHKDTEGNPTENTMGLINPAYPKMGSDLIAIFCRNSTDPWTGNPLARKIAEKSYERKVKQNTSVRSV